jgi:flavin-dependent dehydrogenase
VTPAPGWDVLVVGAGPAGALAAHGLARAGASVLLVDRATFPRPKVCGCCLSARALAVIRGCGLESQLAALRPRGYDTLRLRTGQTEARLSLPAGVAVSREAFDSMIVHAAGAAGTSFQPGVRAALVGRDPAGHWTVALRGADDAERLVHARVVVDAAGLGSGLSHRWLRGESVRAGARIGASATLPASTRVPWTESAVNMTVARHGYVGAVRLEDGRWNLAAALDAVAVARQRGLAPVVRDILASAWGTAAVDVGPAVWRGTPPLTRRPRLLARTGLLLVGDAAGYAEPFTGEGMACALHGAQAIVPVVLESIAGGGKELDMAWTRIVRRDVQRQLALAGAAAWVLRRPALASAVTRLLHTHPELAARPIAWLNGPGATRGATA